MIILYLEVNKTKKELILYQLPNKQVIGCINSLKTQDLCNFLLKRRLRVNIAILNMHKPYIDLFYTLYPDSLICIAPEAIQALSNTQNVENEECISFVSEVAATLDSNKGENRNLNVVNQFIRDFYRVSNAKEALALYETWQTYIPLNDPKVYRCVRTIEFYKREILNYFEFKKALAAFR